MDDINIVSDLLALNTRYHPLCYKTMDNTVKRNFNKDDNNCLNSNPVDIINKIFCFLNTHEQKVYSLKDILSSELQLAEFSKNEMRDLVPMLKRRLNGCYTINSIKGDTNTFIVSDNYLYRILQKDYENVSNDKIVVQEELNSWSCKFTGSLTTMNPSPRQLKRFISLFTSGEKAGNYEFDKSTEAIADTISFNHVKQQSRNKVFSFYRI